MTCRLALVQRFRDIRRWFYHNQQLQAVQEWHTMALQLVSKAMIPTVDLAQATAAQDMAGTVGWVREAELSKTEGTVRTIRNPQNGSQRHLLLLWHSLLLPTGTIISSTFPTPKTSTATLP